MADPVSLAVSGASVLIALGTAIFHGGGKSRRTDEHETRITKLEATHAVDHDVLTALRTDMTYVRQAVDGIRADLKERA